MTSNQILAEIQKKLSAPDQKNYFAIHIDRYRYILDRILKFRPAPLSAALDLGCFPPHLFLALQKIGYDTWGISSSHEKVKSSRIKTADLETAKIPFPDNTFDLILFSEVLEHLSNYPEALFRELRRLLKPQGHLIVTTPNASRTQNIISLILNRNIYFPLSQMEQTSFDSRTINHRHNREYTLTELKTLAHNSGLNIQEAGYFISYTPYREKNNSDPVSLKIIKYLNYLLMLAFKTHRDSLWLVLTK